MNILKFYIFRNLKIQDSLEDITYLEKLLVIED